MGHINIEIKARCNNSARIRKILKSKRADFRGEGHQIDTYFKVPNGRLKLREGNIENRDLISVSYSDLLLDINSHKRSGR